MGLKGRNVLVTGGASGIGRAICLHLARDGADVAVLDLDVAAARRVADEVAGMGRRGVAVEADVASASAVGAAVERVHGGLGPVHVLVNDAGIANLAPLRAMSEEQWDRMIAVHLKGAFNCTRAVLDDMEKAGWGRIVNISSVAGLRGGPQLVHYSAAKAGLIGFTKALAVEVGSLGITVNAIAPGLIDTPMLARSGWPQQLTQVIVAQSPIQRIGTPEDIAAACVYLVSEGASFVTGQVLSPNGGGHL